MPNGVKVRAKILADGRVHPNVIAPNGKRKLVQTIPDRLVEWPEESFNGAYVLLLPTEADQARLAKNAATAQDTLHCTVAYLGDASDINVDGAKIAEALRTVAAETEPIKASLGGIIRFTADNDYKLDPVVLNVDSPKVNEARETILRRMRHDFDIKPDDEHGFTPHLTLGYMPHDEPLVANRLERSDVTFDRMRLGFGGKEFDIRLGKRAADDDRKKREPQIKAFMLNPFYRAALEHKTRHVRTLAGVRRFGLPIGSVIVADPASEFPASRDWADEQHELANIELADEVFGGTNVYSTDVRSETKDTVVRDIAKRLENDLDDDLLSTISGKEIGTTSKMGYAELTDYLNGLGHDAVRWDYASDERRKVVKEKYQGRNPRRVWQELMGMPADDYDGFLNADMRDRAREIDELGLVTTTITPEQARYDIVNAFIGKWAQTSKDWFMQSQAKEQFDLSRSTTEHLDGFSVDHMFDEEENNEAVAKAWQTAYGAYLDAVYESTQELLAEKGIKEVAVYRGMSVAPREYESRFGMNFYDIDSIYEEARHRLYTGKNDEEGLDELVRSSNRRRVVLMDMDPETHPIDSDAELADLERRMQEKRNEALEEIEEALRSDGLDDELLAIVMDWLRYESNDRYSSFPSRLPWRNLLAQVKEKPFKLDIGTQPLSSWTTDPETANRFGDYIYKTIVPVERVWSTALTGAGCLNEYELVLTGGVDHATMMRKVY